MDKAFIIEMVGYLGSFLVLVSMLMSSVKRLRIVNTVGCVIFSAYALIIHSYPTAIMNICLIFINAINLYKLWKESKSYSIIECYKDESIVQLYIKQYMEDINKFFPEFTAEGGGHMLTFLVCTGSLPVGITIGTMKKGISFEIEVDYTIPAYRDNSVGKFLYKYLSQKWEISKFILKKKSLNHEDYLAKLGFKKTENGYEMLSESK